MAVNKSNNPNSPNVVDEPYDFGVSELARIGEQYHRVPQAQRVDRRRFYEAQHTIETIDNMRGGRNNPLDKDTTSRIEAMQRLLERTKDREARKLITDKIYEETVGTALSSVSQKYYQNASKTINKISPRMGSYRRALSERLNEQAVNTVNREFSESSINSFVAGSINNPEIQAIGFGLAGRASFEELGARRQNILGQIGTLRAESVNAAGSFIRGHGADPEASRILRDNAAQVKELASELAPIAVAMKAQKAAGQDPESKQRWAAHLGQKAQNAIDFERMREDISAGKGEYGNLSPAEYKKKEMEAALQLVKALDELRNSAGKSKEEISKLNKSVEEAAKNYDEVEKAGSAGAGGKSNSTLAAAATISTAVGQAFNLVSTGFQVLGVNQPMAQMANIAGYAGIENQKYDSWRAAIGGNMTERLNVASWAVADQFARNRADYARYGVIAKEGGAAFATLGGGIQVVNGFGASPITAATIGDAASPIANGLITTGEGIINTAAAEVDYQNEISAGHARIGGWQQAMAAIANLNKVSGFQLQSARDHAMGMFGASDFMGTRGEGYLKMSGNLTYMAGMHNLGLGSEEASRLAMSGAQNIGSMFNANQVLQAKRFENLGLGSAEDQMRRMAALSAGSTQNPGQGLEKMLERAMTVGLDSSRALNLIADSTGVMAEQTALKGFADVGDEINKQILGAIDRNNPNQELAAKNALAAYQTGEQARNNTNASYHGIMNVSNIGQLGIKKWEDQLVFARTDIATLRKMQRQSPEDLQKSLWKLGVSDDALGADPSGMLSRIIASKSINAVGADGGFANGAAAAAADVAAWAKDPKNAKMLAEGRVGDMPANIREATKLMNWNFARKGDAGQQLRDFLAAIGATSADSTSLGAGNIDEMTGDRGAGARERAAGGRQLLRAGMSGTEGIMSPGDTTAFRALDAGRQGIEQIATEDVWAKAAAETAKNYGESAIQLNHSADRLNDAALALMNAAGALELANGGSSEAILPNGLADLEKKLGNWVGDQGTSEATQSTIKAQKRGGNPQASWGRRG